MFNLRCTKKLASEQQRLLYVKALTGKQNRREETLLTPDVQRYARVDQGKECIETLVFGFSRSAWRMHNRSAVSTKAQGRDYAH